MDGKILVGTLSQQLRVICIAGSTDELSCGNRQKASERLSLVEDFALLGTNQEVIRLAEQYYKHLAFPQRAVRDAYHLAHAVWYQMNYLLTLNCTHLANADIRHQLVKLNLQYGYETPEICMPDELIPPEYRR